LGGQRTSFIWNQKKGGNTNEEGKNESNSMMDSSTAQKIGTEGKSATETRLL